MAEHRDGRQRAVKRDAVVALVREMIADGTLKPGGPASSGEALAARTGYSALTCRAALRVLADDGTLVAGMSQAARPRVACPGQGSDDQGRVELAAALSTTLAALRRATGMRQPEAARRLGVSLTSVGHAETGRLWQSRAFWVKAEVSRRYPGAPAPGVPAGLGGARRTRWRGGSISAPRTRAPTRPASPAW